MKKVGIILCINAEQEENDKINNSFFLGIFFLIKFRVKRSYNPDCISNEYERVESVECDIEETGGEKSTIADMA